MLKGIDSDFRQKYVVNKIKAMQIQAEFPFLQEIINASYGNVLFNGLDKGWKGRIHLSLVIVEDEN